MITNGTATPLLVLAAGQRSGSTLIQRLLTSHPGVLIWGEHMGQLGQLLEMVKVLRDWSDGPGQRARDFYAQDGYQSFMANLTPTTDRIDEAARQLVLNLFAEPAASAGRPVWGLKETRYKLPELRGLRRLFPQLAAIFIIRDPRDVLRSLDVWERGAGWWDRGLTEAAMRNWHRVAESFLEYGPTDPPVLQLRYEEMVADPDGTSKAIAEHTGLDRDRFDMAVFRRRIHRAGPGGELPTDKQPWSALPDSMRELMTPERCRVAAAYGYQIS